MMPRRTTFVLLGIVATALALVLASVLTDRGGMRASHVATDRVEIAGDTVPVGAVPVDIAELLREGRAWRAARSLRSYLANNDDATDEAKLLAARAEAESGSWRRARQRLEGEPWLDRVWNGEGWYWLARAQEETDADREALASYDRYLGLQGDAVSNRHSVAELRRGLVLLRLGRTADGLAALRDVQDGAPELGAWVAVLSAESAALAGDTATASAAVSGAPAGTIMRHRARLASIAAKEKAGDARGAMALAIAYREEGGPASERATFAKEAGRIAHAIGDEATARRELAAAMSISPGTAAGRDAANLTLRLPNLTAEEQLTIALIQERHGNNQRAIDGFRAWLAAAPASASNRNDIRLRLGRALFNAGNFAEAETQLRPLHDASAAIAREAMLLTGRSEYRRNARTAAFRTFETLASRFPGSGEGSEGLFLVADLSHDDREMTTARRVYREVADNFRGTDRAGLSMMRLGGIHFDEEEYARAAAVWEEYRSTYPSGERWLESTYWAGRAHEAMGEDARASALYEAVIQRDPLSYYSLLAADRLDRAYWPIPMAAAPPADPAAESRVAEWMETIDMLREAGLHAEADAEAQRIQEGAPADRALLYSLGEALNERGYAIRGIRIGQRLEQMEGRLNPRLMRILYPFPYRDLIVAEAREAGLDPFVVAGLTRQESLFTQRISSPVGARGLMQIMPETGAALARGANIEEWDAELLFNPEINVHLGVAYLAEQMDVYDESLPSVFSAYNAGPHRINVWKNFPEYDDEELFTERIPYRETRDYVKILSRNIAIYRGLYGDAGDATAGR